MPVSAEKGALGAAAIAASAAIPPASANASVTSRSSGTPTIRAPSASSTIARRPRPERVCVSAQLAAPASASATTSTKSPRTWMLAPPTVTKPSCPIRLNGSGSGKTYAGRPNPAWSPARTAVPTASVAATQPIVDPRERYGCTASRYVPAPAATQTTKPTAIASTKRPPPTLVCVTGPVPAATSSVTNTARPTSSPSAKWTTPVSR